MAVGREHLRSRTRAPFGDEDIPIIFAGTGSQDPEPASDELIACCHTGQYIRMVKNTEKMTDEECNRAADPFDSVYFNKDTNSAARLSVGSVLRAVEAVHRGDVRNSFCLVRPPGHLAMESEACGFSVFNNVAIAAEYAVSQLNYDRVLIVDWGVHHGHATQYQFYNNYRVLCISIHRYDDQTFWPALRESNYEFTGAGRGRGYNINIPLNGDDVGDADYLAIFHHLILPVAFEFDPGLILVSAGYDCALGCPLGQLSLTPSVFAHFTHKLMCLAEGKLVVALEGGYCLDSLAESAAHTLSTLLGDPLPSLECVEEVKPRSNVRSNSMVSFNACRDPEKEAAIARRMEDLKRKHPVAFHSNLNNVCIVYDSRMENHKDEESHGHPETPNRIRRAYELVEEYGLARRCKRVEARFATRSEVLLVHTQAHVDKIAETAGMSQTSLNSLADEEDSIYFNRSLRGMALVRPPGHHATANACMGFCLFNNVAIAARYAQSVYGLTRIAILDWDVHHGNGTQEIFANDPDVLYLSVHRHDDGRFYPNTDKASASEVGEAEGVGRTVQVAWNGKHARDAEYIASFAHIILPVLYEFRPQLILVSAGFDAVRGDPLGCLGVSPECFGHLTHLLLTATHLVPVDEQLHLSKDTQSSTRPGGSNIDTGPSAQSPGCSHPDFTGGIILALEGGYNLESTAEAVCHSLASLLGDSCPRLANGLSPSERGCKSIRHALAVHQKYWSQLGSLVAPSGRVEHRTSAKLRPGSSYNMKAQNQVFADLALRLDDLNLSDTTSPQVPSQLITPAVNCLMRGIRSLTTPLAAEDNNVRPDASAIDAITNPSPVTNQLSTGQSDSQSSTSVEISPLLPLPRPAIPVAAGASATSDMLHPISESTATLRNLISLPGEDMHAFLGLQSDQQLPERLFAVTPLTWCPHLTAVENRPDWRPDINQRCSRCDNTVENWICLTCYTVCCGRYANCHMVEHFSSDGHPIVLSFGDLSSWCYICEHYVHNEKSDEELPNCMYAVNPLTWCPHLAAVENRPESCPDFNQKCSHCDNTVENWVCLTCYKVCCGRYANCHMVEHFSSDGHPIVLSFGDLSSWCYICENYVHNEVLLGDKNITYRYRFGTDYPAHHSA